VAATGAGGGDAGPFAVRRGGARDADVLLALFDDSIRWLTQRGLTAQWGTTLFSEAPERVESVRRWAASGGYFIAERDGRPAAAMVLGDAQPYVPAATEPEVYVVVLVAAHAPFARGAGAHLLARADDVARALGREVVRVDCFAGNGGALVRFYERCGFRKAEEFTVGDWPGQVLARRLSGPPDN
jgi:GNAT superfamily N-acetyltransferase